MSIATSTPGQGPCGLHLALGIRTAAEARRRRPGSARPAPGRPRLLTGKLFATLADLALDSAHDRAAEDDRTANLTQALRTRSSLGKRTES